MKSKLLVLLALAPFFAAAQQSVPDSIRLTLEQCLETVYSNNYNRQSVALNEEAREDSYQQSKQERLPDVSASLGESYSHSKSSSGTGSGGSNWSGNYSLSTGVTLFQGGQIGQTIEKNRLSAEQTVYQTAQYDNQLTIQVLQAFLTALGNEELLQYQQAVLKASEEQARQGRLRMEAGDIIESDYLLLEAQYATDRMNVVETTLSLQNSYDALKNLMSLDPYYPIKVIYPDESVLEQMGVLPTQDQVLTRSIESSPDLRISDYNVEIAETGLRISKSGAYPTVSLSAGIGTGHSNGFSRYGRQLDNRLNEQVGLTIGIPIFSNGRNKYNVTQSRIALQQAELERKQTELDIKQTVIQEYRDVLSAEGKYRSSEIRQSAYLASFEAYRVQFEEGAITAVELLQQQNNYISATNDYIQNKYGFMLKRKVLDVYMGVPVTM